MADVPYAMTEPTPQQRHEAEQLARLLKVGRTVKPPASVGSSSDLFADVPWEEGVQAILRYGAQCARKEVFDLSDHCDVKAALAVDRMRDLDQKVGTHAKSEYWRGKRDAFMEIAGTVRRVHSSGGAVIPAVPRDDAAD